MNHGLRAQVEQELIDAGWYRRDAEGVLVITEKGERELPELPEIDAEPPGPLDLSGYRSAAGAAKALRRWIVERIEYDRKVSEAMGYEYRGPQEEYVILRRPDERDERWAACAWHVVWEEGPFEWAVYLTGGCSMYAGELGGCGTPEATGFHDAEGWHAEPGFSFSLCFWSD